MYSMKRSTTPVPRKCRAMGRIWLSLVPRLTTMLTLTGDRPACCAASMPASTSATGKSTSFMRRNTASSRPSRLTVTRSSPASRSERALRASSEALVVSVMSSLSPAGVRSAASCPISVSMPLRSSGSPPVRRSLCTPWATNSRASRVISSKLSSALCGRYS